MKKILLFAFSGLHEGEILAAIAELSKTKVASVR